MFYNREITLPIDWLINKLKHITGGMDDSYVYKREWEGFHDPGYYYFRFDRSFFGYHNEDLYAFAINMNCYGSPMIWKIFTPIQSEQMQKVINKNCTNPSSHKNYWLHIKNLDDIQPIVKSFIFLLYIYVYIFLFYVSLLVFVNQ